LRSLQETNGGAKVSISVEEAQPGRFEEIKTEAHRSQAAQIALREDRATRLEIEKQLLLDEVIPRMIASGGQHIQIIGSATGVAIASGNASVNARLTVNDLSAIFALLNEFARRHAELGLDKAQQEQIENAIESVKQELHRSEPRHSVISRGLSIMKEIGVKVIESAAEKALTNHWDPLLDQVTHFVNLLAR
jgi:hypothetical protein